MNPYTILEVSVDCTEEEITIAYRKKAKVCHPDVGGDATAFALLAAAVDILRDPRKRKLFDEFGIVMDTTEDTINKKVADIFSSLVTAWIDRQVMTGTDINISSFFNAGYKQANGKLDNSIAQAERQLRYLKRRKKEIVTKDPENKIALIIEGRMQGLSSAIKAEEEEKYIFKLVKDMCDLYESIENTEVTVNRFCSTPTSPDDFIQRMMNQGFSKSEGPFKFYTGA